MVHEHSDPGTWERPVSQITLSDKEGSLNTNLGVTVDQVREPARAATVTTKVRVEK